MLRVSTDMLLLMVGGEDYGLIDWGSG